MPASVGVRRLGRLRRSILAGRHFNPERDAQLRRAVRDAGVHDLWSVLCRFHGSSYPGCEPDKLSSLDTETTFCDQFSAMSYHDGRKQDHERGIYSLLRSAASGSSYRCGLTVALRTIGDLLISDPGPAYPGALPHPSGIFSPVRDDIKEQSKKS